MRSPSDRRRLESELARGKQSAMAGNDASGIVDEDGVQPTELDDRRRNLCYLILAVRAGVARIWDQSLEWPALNPRKDP